MTVKRADIRVGDTYWAKVSGQMVPVRIITDFDSWSGTAWRAKSLVTGYTITIWGPRRLLSKVHNPAS